MKHYSNSLTCFSKHVGIIYAFATLFSVGKFKRTIRGVITGISVKIIGLHERKVHNDFKKTTVQYSAIV